MVNFWSNKQKEISKKDRSWTQAKARNPKLLPFSDADKDGVSNWLDCKPFDKRRQEKQVFKDGEWIDVATRDEWYDAPPRDRRVKEEEKD